MQYVKAEWVPSTMEGGKPMIKATGDDGIEYWVPDVQTDVPPWPAFLETEVGKAFLATASEPEPPAPE